MDLCMHEGYRWVVYGANCSSCWVTWFSRVMRIYLIIADVIMRIYLIIADVNSMGIMIGYITLLCMKYLLFEDVTPIMAIYEIYVK